MFAGRSRATVATYPVSRAPRLAPSSSDTPICILFNSAEDKLTVKLPVPSALCVLCVLSVVSVVSVLFVLSVLKCMTIASPNAHKAKNGAV